MVEAQAGLNWRKVALVGCGCLTAVAVAVGALVALNWPRLSELYQRASASMTELMRIQHTLQTEYSTSQVAVLWRQHAGTSDAMLVVRLINPPFLKELALEDAEPKAREIALLARGQLREPASVAGVEVVLTKQAGFGVTIANSRVFSFTASDLASSSSNSPRRGHE